MYVKGERNDRCVKVEHFTHFSSRVSTFKSFNGHANRSDYCCPYSCHKMYQLAVKASVFTEHYAVTHYVEDLGIIYKKNNKKK